MKRLALCLALLMLLCGCGGAKETEQTQDPEPTQTETVEPEPEPVEENDISFLAMDTYMTVKAWDASDEELAELRDEAYTLDALLSVTNEESEIARLNAGETVALSKHTRALLQRALALCELTDGALDVTIYPLVRAWGFTTGDYTIPYQAKIDALREKTGYSRIALGGAELTLPDGMELDLGSLAKGYTGDRLAEMLRSFSVESAIMDLGGNIHTVGCKPDGSGWRVGVRDPRGDSYLAVITVEDKAVVTSGGYIRYFIGQDGETYWHILDPATGRPAKSGLISVTVVGSEGVRCDALSTALFVMGIDDAADYWREHGGFEAVFIDEDGRITITEGLLDCFEYRGSGGFSLIRSAG